MKKIDLGLILDEIFYDRKSNALSFLLMFLSVSLVVMFPVVTQAYIRFAFERDLKALFWVTAVVAVVYVVKLLIDIRIAKFENKLFFKLRSNTREVILERLLLRGNQSFFRAYDMLERKVELYLLFIRKVVVENFKATVKILACFLVILFFDRHLFFYCLAFIPVFILYILLFRIFFAKNRAETESIERNLPYPDLVLFLESELRAGSSKDVFFKRYKTLESMLLQKELGNRNSLVWLNQSLRASITFFRVVYLTYFGYFIITADVHISSLIVGLLFITILAQAFISMLESIIFYFITRKAVSKVQRFIAGH